MIFVSSLPFSLLSRHFLFPLLPPFCRLASHDRNGYTFVTIVLDTLTFIFILFCLSSNERIVNIEDVSTHDVQSQTEMPLDTDGFAETLEKVKEESNSVSVVSQPETVLRCTLSLESCKETARARGNVPSFDHRSRAVVSAPVLNSQENSVSEQELYNSFHFWRTPLPEIDIDLELQETAGIVDSETQEGKQGVVAPMSSNITMATRKELEEMIENLEPHMDDPDVKGIDTLKHF